jgi:hypothetical protein
MRFDAPPGATGFVAGAVPHRRVRNGRLDRTFDISIVFET